MSDDTGKAGKVFTEDVVAVMLMGVGSLSTEQYKIMSAMDGTKTASSFQHSCRSLLRKAKEIKAWVDNGEEFVPVTAGTSRGPYKRAADGEAAMPPVTPKKSKATPKNTPKATPKATPKGKKTASKDEGLGFEDGIEFAPSFNDKVKKEDLGELGVEFV